MNVISGLNWEPESLMKYQEKNALNINIIKNASIGLYYIPSVTLKYSLLIKMVMLRKNVPNDSANNAFGIQLKIIIVIVWISKIIA